MVAACGGVLSAAAAVLLVPPVNLAALALAAMLLGRRRLAVAALVLVLVLALPLVAGTLLAALEAPAPPPSGPPPQAIIILGGDVRAVDGVPADDVGPLTLERLRAGAALARATHLPILVTGGVVDPDGPPVADLMATSLTTDFATPARWVESRAHDTWENARFSVAMLRAAGIGAAYVVTHPWHMRRALIAFAGTGIAVTPAPLPPDRLPQWHAGAFVPRVGAWRESYFALHEWIGCAWYVLRRRLQAVAG